MRHIIGTCSLCGGNVIRDDSWLSVKDHLPTCEKCGATKKLALPVIEMQESLKKELLLG